MNSSIKIAAIQMDTQNNKSNNLDRAEKLIRRAVREGAQLVSLPEYFNFMGTSEEDKLNAETIPGQTSELLSNLAKELNVWIHGGSIMEEIPGDEKCYNTTLVFNPTGEIVGKYRKIHLFDIDIKNGPSFLESDDVKNGSDIVVVDTEFAKLGLSICYDMRFPEQYRLLALQGAEILFVPSAFAMYTGKDHWEAILRTRAIENQAYVIAPGQIGSKASGPCYGRSMIIDPWGTVIGVATDKETIIIGEIDLTYLQDIRKELPSLKNRKPNVYTLQLTENALSIDRG